MGPFGHPTAPAPPRQPGMAVLLRLPWRQHRLPAPGLELGQEAGPDRHSRESPTALARVGHVVALGTPFPGAVAPPQGPHVHAPGTPRANPGVRGRRGRAVRASSPRPHSEGLLSSRPRPPGAPVPGEMAASCLFVRLRGDPQLPSEWKNTAPLGVFATWVGGPCEGPEGSGSGQDGGEHVLPAYR